MGGWEGKQQHTKSLVLRGWDQPREGGKEGGREGGRVRTRTWKVRRKEGGREGKQQREGPLV